MKKILTAICVAAATLTACNDNFLEKYPLTDLTEENAFKEHDNFKAFINPCYAMFTNTTIHTSINNSYMNAQFSGDWYGGLVTHRDNARILMLIKPSQQQQMEVDGTSLISVE